MEKNLRLFLQARRMETLNLPAVPNAEWQPIAGVSTEQEEQLGSFCQSDRILHRLY